MVGGGRVRCRDSRRVLAPRAPGRDAPDHRTAVSAGRARVLVLRDDNTDRRRHLCGCAGRRRLCGQRDEHCARWRVRGVRIVSSPRAPRRDLRVRRVLLLQQCRGRGAARSTIGCRPRRDSRRRLPPRQWNTADLLRTPRRVLRVAARRSCARLPLLRRPPRRNRSGPGARCELERSAPRRHRR